MRWTVVVPLKCGAERKTRLASVLSSAQRTSLTDAMATHVFSVLASTARVARLVCLAPRPFEARTASWWVDEGRGLNQELTAFRAAHRSESIAIVHGDLPLLREEDVRALFEAAERESAAIAPDRLRQGTNALALTPTASCVFSFGEGSFAVHRASISPAPAIVERVGLSHDIDTPQDVEAILGCGGSLDVELAQVKT